MQWNAFGVKKLMIHATIIRGKFKGEEVPIARTPKILSDIECKQIQFPICFAITLTIIKSQGQSLSVSGPNSENACFTNGRL